MVSVDASTLLSMNDSVPDAGLALGVLRWWP